jgi:O-antigen biosynthesis protein
VAQAPGGPVHVLLSDTVAEHIPGCNFAVRRDWLTRIGGFDPRFRAAGDDVDVCWRLQEAGGHIGFHPAALVWHHRRNSMVRYLKQQRGYGRAEALLARKWPQKYNDFGHMRWAGQLYGRGILRALRLSPSRIYHGPWGSAPFQSLYAPSPGLLAALVQMPEWYLLTALLLAVGAAGAWSPVLLAALPLGLLALGAIVGQTLGTVRRIRFAGAPGRSQRLRLRLLTATLSLLQPIARLWGRVEYGLSPWRRLRRSGWVVSACESIWSERWRDTVDWLQSVCADLRARGADYVTGREFDAWDLRVGGGLFGRAYLSMVIEEHGDGRQMVRFRVRPQVSGVAVALVVGAAAAALLAPGTAVIAALIAWWTYREIGAAVEQARQAVRTCGRSEAPP